MAVALGRFLFHVSLFHVQLQEAHGLVVPGHPLARQAGAQASMTVSVQAEHESFVCASRHPLAGTTTIRGSNRRKESVSPFALMTVPLALSFAVIADYYAAVAEGGLLSFP